MHLPLRLTPATLMLDIETEWTLNASLTTLSSYRKCSKRRILGHSAQRTSRLRIEDTTKCSRIARGFGFGSISGFAADLNLKAGLGFRTSATFPASASVGKSLRIPIGVDDQRVKDGQGFAGRISSLLCK